MLLSEESRTTCLSAKHTTVESAQRLNDGVIGPKHVGFRQTGAVRLEPDSLYAMIVRVEDVDRTA